MPIAEACHVALQRLPTGSFDMSAEERGRGPASISVVSFHADPAHRSPIFTAPLSDLLPAGLPLEYKEAQEYFKANPSTSWAGCGLVSVNSSRPAFT